MHLHAQHATCTLGRAALTSGALVWQCSGQLVNQFPYEACIIRKDLLPATLRRLHAAEREADPQQEAMPQDAAPASWHPQWFPPAFDLATEVQYFLRDYAEVRRQASSCMTQMSVPFRGGLCTMTSERPRSCTSMPQWARRQPGCLCCLCCTKWWRLCSKDCHTRGLQHEWLASTPEPWLDLLLRILA